LLGRLAPDGLDADLAEDAKGLALLEVLVLEGQQEGSGDLVVDGPDDGAAEAGAEDVLLDPHQDAGLGAGLLALQHVHVHLVAVEVGVVRRADAEVHAEGLAGHDADLVGHHAHAVQRGLPVEQHDVAVLEVALHHGAGQHVQLRGQLRVLRGDLDAPPVGADDVVDPRQVFAAHAEGGLGAALDQLPGLLDVVRRDLDGHGQLAGRVDRHADLVDADVGVGADDGAGAEVDALPRQVAAEAAFLALEALAQGLEGATGAVPRGRDAAGLVVHVGGDVVLQQLPQVLDDELRRARVAVLLEALVDAQHVDQLVGEVVLAALAALQGDAGPHRHRGNRQHGQHHPLRAGGGAVVQHRAAPFHRAGVDAQQLQLVVGDLLQPLADVHGGELVALLAEGRGLLEVDLLLGLVAGRAGPVGGLEGRRGLVDQLDEVADVLAVLEAALVLREVLAHRVLRQQHVAAGPAGRAQDVADDLREADVDDRHGQVDVAEVARAVAHGAAAGLAAEARLDDAQAGVHQAHLDGEAVVVVGVGGDDLRRRHLADLAGAEEGEGDGPDLLGRGGEVHHHTRSSSWMRGATISDFSSSRRSLKA
jgi:hypothetical protein